MKNQWFFRGYQKIKIGLLYIKHLTTVCPVELMTLEMGREQIHDQWRAILTWNVKGCNRIHIEGHGIFAGNIKAVSIKAVDKKNCLTITFIGVFDRITREIAISAENRNIVSQFSAIIQPFQVSPVPFRLQQIIPTITPQFIKIQEVDFSLQVGVCPSAVEYLNICPINQSNH